MIGNNIIPLSFNADLTTNYGYGGLSDYLAGAASNYCVMEIVAPSDRMVYVMSTTIRQTGDWYAYKTDGSIITSGAESLPLTLVNQRGSFDCTSTLRAGLTTAVNPVHGFLNSFAVGTGIGTHRDLPMPVVLKPGETFTLKGETLNQATLFGVEWLEFISK
tara:strand:+ start:111 stop:593 length:483 start_codon:yes stop_codon:yes gene_type:complete